MSYTVGRIAFAPVVSLPVQPRVARAEAEYKRAQKDREAAESRAEQQRLSQHARSQQQAQQAREALSHPHRSLAVALAWFQSEWQAATPTRIHQASVVDPSGAPEWTERWKTWLMEVDPDDETRARDPLRRAHLAMRASGNAFDMAGADFLFRFACLGYDLERAALSLDPPIPLLYLAWYAEKAIDRLREKVEGERHRKPKVVPKPEWMARLGIGRSEAQAHAEEAIADG